MLELDSPEVALVSADSDDPDDVDSVPSTVVVELLAPTLTFDPPLVGEMPPVADDELDEPSVPDSLTE